MGPAQYIVIIAFLAIGIGGFLFSRMRGKKQYAKQGDDFLSRHPDAARVYVTSGAANTVMSQVALDDQITICKVDNVVADGYVGGQYILSREDLQRSSSAPQMSYDLFARQGDHMLIVPGQHTLSLAAAHSRPGVLYKQVATAYGPMDYLVELWPGRSYQLSFDRKSQSFAIAEREPVSV